MDPSVARGIAHSWHLDQRDGDGRLLTEHVERVASAVPPAACALAFLHELLDSTGISHEELRASGLTAAEASALELLTRTPGESYALYALRIAHAPGLPGRLARAVMIADLEEHLQRGRRARATGSPPFAWAHRHIAIARERRGETVWAEAGDAARGSSDRHEAGGAARRLAWTDPCPSSS